MSISLGIIFGLIAMFGYGLSNAIVQVPVREIGSRKALFYRNIGISILFLPMLFIFSVKLSPLYILIAFAIALLGYIPAITFMRALKAGKVGIISPISNSSVIFTILLAVIFFKEKLMLTQLLSIILIIAGIILVSIDFRDLKNSHLFMISSGVPLALITCFLWGIVYFLFKIPVDVLGAVLTSFIIEFGIMIYSGIHLKISKINFSLPKKLFPYLLFVAIGGAAGTLFFSLGIEIADVSIVSTLTFANPLVAVLYGKFVYKEKLKLQQYAAILLILAGIVLISYF